MEPQGRAQQAGKFLAAGRVVRPHGIRGEILIEGVAELMASLIPGKTIYFGDGHTPKKLVAIRPHQNRYLVSLEGVVSRDRAEGLRAAEVYIETADAQELTPGAYYHWQILGLDVVSQDGEALGTVKGIIETGANDVYVVGKETGKDLLVPAISSTIRSVDLDAGTIIVNLIPGLREVQE